MRPRPDTRCDRPRAETRAVDRIHSRSLLQAVRLTGAQAHVPRREFIHCSGWDASPFRELRARLEVDPGWRVSELPTGHNAMREAPGAVAALLLAS